MVKFVYGIESKILVIHAGWGWDRSQQGYISTNLEQIVYCCGHHWWTSDSRCSCLPTSFHTNDFQWASNQAAASFSFWGFRILSIYRDLRLCGMQTHPWLYSLLSNCVSLLNSPIKLCKHAFIHILLVLLLWELGLIQMANFMLQYYKDLVHIFYKNIFKVNNTLY